MKRTPKLHFLISNAMLLAGLGLSVQVMSLELLSEGAMGTVSATPGLAEVNVPVDEIENGEYEELPFKTGLTIDKKDTNRVSVDLEFSLTEEVGEWANKLRENGSIQLEIGVIEELPPSEFDTGPLIIFDEGAENSTIREYSVLDKKGAPANYELGLVTRTAQLHESTADYVRVSIQSYVERAATLNASPFGDGVSIGSTYLTNITSSSNITIQRRE